MMGGYAVHQDSLREEPTRKGVSPHPQKTNAKLKYTDETQRFCHRFAHDGVHRFSTPTLGQGSDERARQQEKPYAVEIRQGINAISRTLRWVVEG